MVRRVVADSPGFLKMCRVFLCLCVVASPEAGTCSLVVCVTLRSGLLKKRIITLIIIKSVEIVGYF